MDDPNTVQIFGEYMNSYFRDYSMIFMNGSVEYCSGKGGFSVYIFEIKIKKWV